MEFYEMFCPLVMLFAMTEAVFGDTPLTISATMSLWPSETNIFIGEKTIVNTTIRFPKHFHSDVEVTIYPTLDGPDLVITKVTQVKIGSRLRLSGSAKPIMDFGIEKFQVPGSSLSCQFNFGDVKKIERPATNSDDDSIFIQYEAMVPIERDEGLGAGHTHRLGMFVKEGKEYYTFCTDEVVFAVRSMPLLFQALNKVKTRTDGHVEEMTIRIPKQQNFLRN